MLKISMVTTASAAEIWKIWSDVENSPVWDKDVNWSYLNGQFLAGSQGAFKLKNGPKLSFVLDNVMYQQYYSNTVKLFGIKMQFKHNIESISINQRRITHGVVINGPIGMILRPLLKVRLHRSLKTSLKNMIDLAEKR